MLTLEEIREYRSRYNEFGKLLGVEIIELDEGYARCMIPVTKQVLNPNNSVHGGVLFTLGDTTSGAAASSRGMRMATMDASFSFLAPAIDSKVLYGEAKEIKKGKTVCVYDVLITDDTDTLIAKGTFTYFSLGVPIKESVAQQNGIRGSIITDHEPASSSASRQA